MTILAFTIKWSIHFSATRNLVHLILQIKITIELTMKWLAHAQKPLLRTSGSAGDMFAIFLAASQSNFFACTIFVSSTANRNWHALWMFSWLWFGYQWAIMALLCYLKTILAAVFSESSAPRLTTISGPMLQQWDLDIMMVEKLEPLRCQCIDTGQGIAQLAGELVRTGMPSCNHRGMARYVTTTKV